MKKRYRIPWLVALKKRRVSDRKFQVVIGTWLALPLEEKRKHPDYFDLSEHISHELYVSSVSASGTLTYGEDIKKFMKALLTGDTYAR